MTEPIRDSGLGWPAYVPRETSVELIGRAAGLGWPVVEREGAEAAA